MATPKHSPDSTDAETISASTATHTTKQSSKDDVRPYLYVCLLLWVIIAGLLTFGFMNSNDERIYIGF
ncbi:MAG TPA: hypothetical protein PLZ21_07280, partial [Armatimonadota bacterium]|nr:hypothetical protein [Armatimonadota bacterium]